MLGVGRYWPAYIAPGEGIWHQYRSISLYPSDLVVAVAVGAWLSARAAGARFARPGLALGPVIGLGALVLATALSATSAAEGALAIGVAGQLALLALFFVAVAELIAGEHRRPILAGLCLAVLVQAILAGWQAVTQSTAPAGALFNGWTVEFAAPDRGAIVAALPGVDRWLRAYGSFAHPNILGIFLALSLAVLFVADDAPPRWRALALAAGALALTLTFSRVAWLAVALAGAAWLVARYGRGAPAWLARTLRARP
ncbi:MAG: hypothetical protein ACRDPC_29780, partial [Solirubrobacteraceae bacterium]